jgi:hypothetical protein
MILLKRAPIVAALAGLMQITAIKPDRILFS